MAGIADVGMRLRALLEFTSDTWLKQPDEVRSILEDLVTEAGEAGETGTVARAANRLAEICRLNGELERAEKLARQAREAGQAAGDSRQEAAAWNTTGLIHYDRAEYARAHECYGRCLELSRAAAYVEGELAALNQLGILLGFQGRVAEALDCYERCLAIDVERGSHYGEVVSRINVGWMLEQLGRWEDAAEHFYRAVAISEQHGYEDWRLLASCNLGELFTKRQRLEPAITLFSTVIAVERRREQARPMLGIALAHLGQAMVAKGDAGAAAASYAEAVRIFEAVHDKYDLARVSRMRAELALESGRLADAEEFVGRAAELAAEQGLKRELGEVLRVRGLLFVERGDDEAAQDCFERAIGELAETPESFEMARTCLQFGRRLARRGDVVRARALLRQAAGTFRRLSVVAESEEANRLLFHIDVPERGENAVLAGLRGLERIGQEPAPFVQEALRLLCAGLGYDGGAVVNDTRVVLAHGAVDPEAAARDCSGEAPPESSGFLRVSLAGAGSACLYLVRSTPGESVAGKDTLAAVARLLAEPVRKLVEQLPAATVESRFEGLEYAGVIGRCDAVLRTLEVVARVADAAVPVLIRGESGTGKELVARALHESSRRRPRPFVAINCAAVPEGLLEADFFGVTKGAATGVAARRGKFEQANGGTVFLDEIGDMSPGLQAKLLRVLQEGAFEPVGGGRTVSIDVRVVAATNQPIDELIRDGRFRADLYYRLNAVEVILPPLRERREDIPEFVRYFVKRSNREFGRNVQGAGEAALGIMLAYDWPGNVRELQHVVERAVILAREPYLTPDDLPLNMRAASPDGDATVKTRLRKARQDARARGSADVEKALLLDCLQKTDWNVSAAAELAGYSRAQFYRLLDRHKLSRPE
jgi:DNA-binding NtrC family response regulator/tetratricopeptide (TPR) repeat protein